MKLQIRVDEQGIISDVKFKTFGCGSAIASSSYMTERVKGLSLEDAGKIKNTEIAKELCLPPVKLHCSSKFRTWFPFMSSMLMLDLLSAGGGCHSFCYS
jgi:NifU-like protein involved in Fe-S cluster formation